MANTIEEFAQLETLWDKAIQSPAEISLEEKHQPANTQRYLRQSVEDLIHKVAIDPHSLTYAECRLIKDDFHVFDIMEQIKYGKDRRQWIRARPDLQVKREQALAAVLSPTERRITRRRRKSRHQRPRHLPKEWIQNIIDQGEDKSWGYIFYYYKGQEGWEEFQYQFKDILTTRMFSVIGLNKIEDSKVAEFVEFEAREEQELDLLRKDFRNRRSRGELKPGILSNVFFLVTDEARISYSRRRQHSFAWAIDPDWSRSGADEDGCNGQLKISATQIYFRFYEFMSTKKLTLKDIWRDFHQVNITQTFMPGPLPAWHFTNLGKPGRWYLFHVGKVSMAWYVLKLNN
ncbi:hypothetical protein BDV29DRAFT_192822 [Aspergillus leporis]|uniref:Uncharacterized protein n=1 Tax=Aspergillus leporis TaxID=41062 RepID=A0A5N5WU55_9EURO|nr:hypothetical protein BDV29DRAFT_192822 [Aspergillus leporis]